MSPRFPRVAIVALVAAVVTLAIQACGTARTSSRHEVERSPQLRYSTGKLTPACESILRSIAELRAQTRREPLRLSPIQESALAARYPGLSAYGELQAIQYAALNPPDAWKKFMHISIVSDTAIAPRPVDLPVYDGFELIWNAGVEDGAVVSALVDTKGKVKRLKFRVPSRDPSFDSCVARSVRASVFTPLRSNGLRVEAWVRLKYEAKFTAGCPHRDVILRERR